jgi:hypothetical protein
MKRRRILRLTTYIAGGALAMPVAGAFLGSCKEVEVDLDSFTPSFFKKEEFQFISDMSDALLPSSETPGALDVGVPEMFDIMVNNVFTSDQQSDYRNKLGKLMAYVNRKKKEAGTSEMINVIASIDSGFRDSNASDKDVASAYQDLRGRTQQYYVGSEIVGTTLLNYLPVPGSYEPCIDLSEVNGKAWAL